MLHDVKIAFEQAFINLDEGEFWFFFAILSVISLLSFYRMGKAFSFARLIENIPTAKVRSAAQGYIELIGQARLMEGPMIVSPLSGKHCVWFRYVIEEETSSYSRSMKRTRWQLVKKQTSEELFLLEDDTGACVIDPDDADVITNNKRRWTDRHRYPPRRYTEELITEHEPLYAMGFFKTVAEVDRQTFRHQVADLLKSWKQNPQLMLQKYDSNRDGEISVQEWQQASKDAHVEIQQKNAAQTRNKPLSVMKKSPFEDQPFILSTESESKLIRVYKRRAAIGLIVFFSLGSLIIWAIDTRMGW